MFNQRPHTWRVIHYHRHDQNISQALNEKWKKKSLPSNFSGAITSSFDTFFNDFPVSDEEFVRLYASP